jgi:hypothetical protein
VRVEGGGWRRRVEGRGWRVEGGGWRVEGERGGSPYHGLTRRQQPSSRPKFGPCVQYIFSSLMLRIRTKEGETRIIKGSRRLNKKRTVEKGKRRIKKDRKGSRRIERRRIDQMDQDGSWVGGSMEGIRCMELFFGQLYIRAESSSNLLEKLSIVLQMGMRHEENILIDS